MSLGLTVFTTLCGASTTLDALRAGCLPGSPAWVALTELVLAVDGWITAVVHTDGLEEED